ncbi:MAG: GNAT family N-acetyltransferase [Acidimicrobiia bacterium]|nr:GNAT family N-acetyltransferase [Acidimicrobiia bacterium]
MATDRLDSEVGAALTGAHLAEMEHRYGAGDEEDGLVPEQLAAPHGTFLVAWIDGVAVGCGGLRRIKPGIGEIKRMYVAPSTRRAGVARTILAELETHARSLTYTLLKLETGIKQPEAIELYLSAGYELIEPYGVYQDSPLSRCYSKVLDP